MYTYITYIFGYFGLGADLGGNIMSGIYDTNN